MKLAAEVATTNPTAITTYETTPVIPDLNLLVRNDYKQPGSPELFINGNILFFTVDGQVREQLELDAGGLQKTALEKIGIKEKQSV